MAKKNRSIPLPRYMTPVRRRDHVAYKYQRHVPNKLQHLLGRKMWDLSLGSDLAKATAKCAAYTAEHDRQIALLKDDFESVVRRGLESITAAKLQADIAHKPDTFAITWRDVESEMKDAAKLPPAYEREKLAIAAWQAFGDRSHLDAIETPTPIASAALGLPVSQPPNGGDPISLTLYNALHTALNARLADLVGKSAESDEYRLTALRAKYFKLNNSSPATVRSYTSKIDKLVDHMGDLPLHQITPEKLRVYRDSIVESGMTANSVAQYFAPVRAVMRWVLSEELVPGFASLPTDKVKMPRNDTPLEEKKWQRFDDAEIKRVWGIVQKTWGPESKYTPERRSAFKWAFRVGLYTAARPVEIFRLSPDNVTPDFITLTETKTRISRKLPLSRHLSGFYEYMQNGGWNLDKTQPGSVSGGMSDSFTKAIRAAGFTNDRQVLYSYKDTLVDRLQRAGHSDDVIRGVTGHVSGQGQLRNYKTRLNDTPEGLAILRTALDGVTYW